MRLKSEIMDEMAIKRAVKRIAHEILEKNKGSENLCLIGIYRRGVSLAKLIADSIAEIEGKHVPMGKLDITLYRDDVSEVNNGPIVTKTEVPFDVIGKKIVLVDDVLYTGRTVRAALDAIIVLGRPNCIQLAVLIDRGHRELPIRGDYIGKNIPTSKNEAIKVNTLEFDHRLSVEIYERD